MRPASSTMPRKPRPKPLRPRLTTIDGYLAPITDHRLKRIVRDTYARNFAAFPSPGNLEPFRRVDDFKREALAATLQHFRLRGEARGWPWHHPLLMLLRAVRSRVLQDLGAHYDP